jgi:tetratricopeptide (TPR) repeat protein
VRAFHGAREQGGGQGTARPTTGAFARVCRGGGVALCGLVWLGTAARAEDASPARLLAQGEVLSQKHESRAALQVYLQAEKLFPANAEVQIKMAEAYMDLMHGTKSKSEQKTLAAQALACGQKAAADDAQSARAHVCVAIGYAKSFPYLDNQTKVNYSRLIKAEAEKAIGLDPKFDLSYHMLGRWNCEVANMNLLLAGLVRIVYGGLPKASNQMAIQNFKKAIELAPARIIHHLQLAHVYHITGEKKLMTAELKACAGYTPVDLDDSDAQQIAAKVLETGKWPAEF